MLGVILCGGQSSRMGQDKGLIKLHANTWAKTAVDKIAALEFPVVLSVNATQYPDYLSVFDATRLIKDEETLDLKGPLAGVLSVHLRYPSEDLFILACDMPLMENVMLKELLAVYGEHPAADACVFTSDGEPEPLCAVYKAKGLAYIMQLQQSKALKRHSMKFVLGQISTFSTALNDDQKKYFRNFNAHAELNGL